MVLDRHFDTPRIWEIWRTYYAVCAFHMSLRLYKCFLLSCVLAKGDKKKAHPKPPKLCGNQPQSGYGSQGT